MKVFGLVLTMFAPIACLGADESLEMQSVKIELEALKQGEKDIQRSLQVIKDVLMGKAPFLEDVFVSVAGSPALGDGRAKVILLEFSDYQCPACGAFARQARRRLVDQYVKTGKVRLVFRDFPLDGHPLAEKAAEAAHCAGDQGKFWQAHDLFFDNQQLLGQADLMGHASALGLVPSEFERCLTSGKYATAVDRDISEGAKLGVRATPTFFLGYVDSKNPSRIHALKSLSGALAFREFQAAIEELEAVSQTGETVESSKP